MSKTSYTIPEVAGICHVSEKLVISWADQGKLKTSKVNLENCVYREDLVLFMNRVGFSTEALETPPTKEEALKNVLYRERAVLYNLLLREATLETGTERGKDYQAILEEMKSLGILEAKPTINH